MRSTAIVFLVLAALLFVRSTWVFGRCGYDCEIFPGGPASVMGPVLSIVLAVVAAIFFTIARLRAFRRRRRTTH